MNRHFLALAGCLCLPRDRTRPGFHFSDSAKPEPSPSKTSPQLQHSGHADELTFSCFGRPASPWYNLSKGGADHGHGYNQKELGSEDARRVRWTGLNTRITVWGLVNSRRLGAADEQILKNIVGLTPEDLDAAWDYHREHPAEIDEDIRDNEAD
jgi:hypothetical protein